MTRAIWLLAVAALWVGCTEGKQQGRQTRAELRKTGPTTVEVIPSAGQLPYCLLYTVSEKGVIRQLTLTRENRSIRCDAGKPVAHTDYRIPAQEGKVRLYIFFSDERIPAGPVAQQLYDLRGLDRINAMDLRLPGRVFIETLEFTPEEPAAAVTGGEVGSGGRLADAGTGNGAGSPVLPDGGTVEGAAAPPGSSEEAP